MSVHNTFAKTALYVLVEVLTGINAFKFSSGDLTGFPGNLLCRQ